LVVAALACLMGAVPAGADAGFRAFIDALRPEARAAGVSDAVFDRSLKAVSPDRSLPDLIQPGESRPRGPGQAEFVKTPLEYLNLPQLEALATQGRQLAIQHAATLARIEREFGVERHILLAIWGRETAYGRYRLQHDVVRVLATQAYMGRRKDLFRKELIAALRMIEDRVLDPNTMKASWAGALGLVQFMPSEYYDLAVDFDGDGRKDIWNSIPDALASAASQLKAKGWTSGQPWGVEVRLPASEGCLHEGQPQSKPLAGWRALGVARRDDKPFAARPPDEPAFVLTPGGAFGPAFLVTANFMVLKAYNFADLYAVFVGHLADRIGGGGGFLTPWTTPKMLSAREIEEIQERLRARGYPVDKLDGKAGMNTRNLIGRYQKASGLAVDCWPSAAVLTHLRKG
jgi:lytic murein transglycosylase